MGIQVVVVVESFDFSINLKIVIKNFFKRVRDHLDKDLIHSLLSTVEETELKVPQLIQAFSLKLRQVCRILAQTLSICQKAEMQETKTDLGQTHICACKKVMFNM